MLARTEIDLFLSAAQLGMTEKQRKYLVLTLELLESGKVIDNEYSKIELGNDSIQYKFDIKHWWHDLNDSKLPWWRLFFPPVTKTAIVICCIGGTACMLANDEDLFLSKLSDNLDNLFYGFGKVPVKVIDAATQLRKFLETGKCELDWNNKNG